MLSQRPGPQGGGTWAHSSTSSSQDEPRKPAGQTQRKEPGRFSQTPRPHRPGLWVHSFTSAEYKGPQLISAPQTPFCFPNHPSSKGWGLPTLFLLHPGHITLPAMGLMDAAFWASDCRLYHLPSPNIENSIFRTQLSLSHLPGPLHVKLSL